MEKKDVPVSSNVVIHKNLNPEWLFQDETNLENILAVLENTDRRSVRDTFLNSITNLDFRETLDLGFGLTKLISAQYGGHVSTWITVLVFQNEVIQCKTEFDESDIEVVEVLFKKRPDLKVKAESLYDQTGKFSFSFHNSEGFQRYINGVERQLGSCKFTERGTAAQNNFDLLVNPLHRYRSESASQIQIWHRMR